MGRTRGTKLSLLVLAGAVAILGVALAQGSTVSLTFLRHGGQLHDSYLVPIIAAFEKENPDIRIQSDLVVTGGYEAGTQKILLAAAAGTPHDLAQVGYSFMRTLVEQAGAVPLDSFMAADARFRADNLFPAMLALGKLDGRQYLVPLATSTPTLYYNVAAFRAAGLDPERPPRTWAEAAAAARRLQAAGYEGMLWGWTITGNWIFQAMVENAGGRLASEDGRRVTFNQAPGQRAVEHLAELVNAGLMPTTTEHTPLFTSGRLGMLVSSTAGRVSVERASKFEVRLAQMPTPDGAIPRLPAGGNGVMMLAQDPAKQRAAWRFIRFLTEPEASRIVAENTGYTPGNQEIAARVRVEKAGDRNYQVVIAQAPQVVPWHSWPGRNSIRISQVLRDMQEAIVLGRAQPRQALEQAATTVASLLGR
jgi:multiple sugar transport system substrate-binding protein